VRGGGRSPAERTFTACGTVEYMAPEIVMLQGHGPEVDWWAVGILLYEMQHSWTPFTKRGTLESDMEIIRNIRKPHYALEFKPSVSAEARGLMQGLLRHTCGTRFGAASMRDHPFFAGFDWDGLLHKRLAPPHIPALSDPFDVANFDPDVEVPGAVLLNLPAEPYPVGDDPWDREF